MIPNARLAPSAVSGSPSAVFPFDTCSLTSIPLRLESQAYTFLAFACSPHALCVSESAVQQT